MDDPFHAPRLPRRIAIACFLLCLALPTSAGAQDVEGPARAEGAGSPDVYINDSFEAADAIQTARRQAAAGQWSQAIEGLQRTATGQGDRLIRARDQVFITVREHISRMICGWSEEGLAAYREIAEPELTARWNELSSGSSAEERLRLLDGFFCTAKAAELADQAAQSAIEAGDFALARRWYTSVLETHPNAARHADRYRGMVALIDALAGEARIADFDAEVRIRWMGEERRLGEVIEGWRSLHPVKPEFAETADWPLLGGHLTRNRPAQCQVDELGMLWRFTGLNEPPDGRGADVEPLEENVERETARHLSMQPVLAGNLLFLQTRREIVALQKNTGFVAWRSRFPSGDGPSGDVDDQAPATDGVTVSDGRVYAALAGDAGPYYGYEGSRTPPELVCLDAATGRLLWRLGQEAFGETFAEIGFDSSPLVERGRVYVVARRRRSFGFEDCYLLKLHAATGAIEFRTHLGSASTGSFGFKRATTAMAALWKNTVFVCTNLGTMAAVAADSGAVRWLRVYPRENQTGAMESNWTLRTPSSWSFNPALVSEGRVIVRPLDASAVFIFSAEDGRMVREIPAKDLGGAESILGLHNDILCAAGSSISCYDVQAAGVLWSTELHDPWRLGGRGQWVDDRLLIPTRAGLSTFRIANGERRDVPWDAQGQIGNLLATPDQLFVVGDAAVSSYVRKTDLWNSLRARMTAAAADPLPALDFAEVALRGGDDRDALGFLFEAVERVERRGEPPDAGLQRRLFDDLLVFPEAMAPRSTLEGSALERLCDLAAQYALDAETNLQYRLRCGSLYEKLDRPQRALVVYQQVLRDRSLRTQTVEDQAARSARKTAPVLAATTVQGRIAALVERHGVGLYAPYEDEAKRWLENAQAGRDADQLTRVVETFPNSHSAAQAMAAIGELTRDAGRFDEAARVLAQAFHRYGAQLDRGRLVGLIADSYARSGRTGAAYRWLTKGMREFADTLVARDGKWVSFKDYRDLLVPSGQLLEPVRPVIVPPLSRHEIMPLPGGVTLLSPVLADQTGQDWSRVFLGTPDGIRALDAATWRELWPAAAATRASAELLVARKEFAVFATRHELFALDADTGARRWIHGSVPEQETDPRRDWEGAGAFTAHAVQDDQLVSFRDNGWMSSVSIGTGEELWAREVKIPPVGPVRLADPWVIYHAVADGFITLCQINAATGDWIGLTPTDETRAVEDLRVALDGQVILAGTQSVAAYDIDAGVRRWRIQIDGTLRPSSLLLDLDALYFSADGRTLRKISLSDGATLWDSPVIVQGTDENVTVQHVGRSLIVSSATSIGAVDEASGQTLWQGTRPAEVRWVRRIAGQRYAVLLDLGTEGAESRLFFYDLRESSGVIPEPGGVVPVGILENFRALGAYDGAVVVQDGTTIHWWGE